MCSPSCFSLGGRERRGVQYNYTDKENYPVQEEELPILYRDEEQHSDGKQGRRVSWQFLAAGALSQFLSKIKFPLVSCLSTQAYLDGKP